jgi:hypothetical protein
MNVEELELQFMDIPKKAFDQMIFSHRLKSVSILNSQISNNDIIVLLNSIDKKTTASLRNCVSIYDD